MISPNVRVGLDQERKQRNGFLCRMDGFCPICVAKAQYAAGIMGVLVLIMLRMTWPRRAHVTSRLPIKGRIRPYGVLYTLRIVGHSARRAVGGCSFAENGNILMLPEGPIFGIHHVSLANFVPNPLIFEPFQLACDENARKRVGAEHDDCARVRNNPLNLLPKRRKRYCRIPSTCRASIRRVGNNGIDRRERGQHVAAIP